jgi:hypothetical protein
VSKWTADRIKTRVEKLVEAVQFGGTMEPDLVQWVKDLKPMLTKKLARVGLIPNPEPEATTTLAAFLAQRTHAGCRGESQSSKSAHKKPQHCWGLRVAAIRRNYPEWREQDSNLRPRGYEFDLEILVTRSLADTCRLYIPLLFYQGFCEGCISIANESVHKGGTAMSVAGAESINFPLCMRPRRTNY